MSKEQIFKMLEGRIDTMQNLAVECAELVFNAGYNEGLEAAAKIAASYDNCQGYAEIKGLKK